MNVEPPSPLFYVNLHLDLINNGWILTSLPGNFEPALTNYSNVYRYTRGSEIAYVYKFATPTAALEGGENTCISKWHPNTPNGQNACYNVGKDCKPTGVNDDGTIIIVCC